MYRKLIKGLSSQYRCIAPDHVGFGLSDKPCGASYRPQMHARNLEALIDRLALKDITLVVHDWGGPIGMAYAITHPANIRRLVVLNTTSWSLKGVRGAERFSAFVGSRLGRFLCLRLNLFPRFVIPSLFARRSRLTRAIHKQYLAPFPTPASRLGYWMLVKALIAQSDWLDAIWQARGALRDKQTLIVAGEQDPTFGPEKLARWQEALPYSETRAFPDAGHFVAEELGVDLVPVVRKFLERTSLPTAGGSNRQSVEPQPATS
jgi:haloalkane dehalogenase